MSSTAIDNQLSPINSQQKIKLLYSLSTLTQSNSPSPIIFNNTVNPNLTKFKTINITDKIKKQLSTNQSIKNKRNHSLQNINLNKDYQNPQNNFNKIDSLQLQVNHLQQNKQFLQQAKANNFTNKLFGNTKPKQRLLQSSRKFDMTLPLIQPKKSSSTRKANFLQQWLDQALDPQDISVKELKQLSSQNIQTSRLQHDLLTKPIISSHLTTVKKYQIDKQYLKSQNIPVEIIDRLYNTLFIYTHGINNIFTELLSFVKTSTDEDPKDSRILSNFWKCFVKLLEGCTSFQTTFQKVQQQYVAKYNVLKNLMIQREQQYEKQKLEHKQVLFRHEKQRLEYLHNYNKLQADYKIAVSTLQLTDHAFNQQVQLRLKFEQKINHIYSSYEQLKVKYQGMMGSLSMTHEQNLYKASIQVQMKNKIRQLQGKIQQYKDLLNHQKSIVKQRDIEVNIKRQQMNDLQKNLQLRQQKQKQQQDVIQSQVNRNNLLKTKVDELTNRLRLAQYTNENIQQKLKQQIKTIELLRQMNQQLHVKYNQTTKKLTQYQAFKIYQTAQIQRLSAQLIINKEQLVIINQQKIYVQSNLVLVTDQLQEKKYEVQVKNQAMDKINNTIQDLKAIKDKYERLWKIIQKQKIQVQKQRNRIKQRYELQKQQIIGLKMLQQNRQKQIKQIQSKHDKQRQLLKRKITGYNQIVTKKQSQILNYQKNQQQKTTIILNKTYRIQQLQKQLSDQKIFNQRKNKQNIYLFKKIQDTQIQIKSIKEQLKSRGKQLQTKLSQLDISQQQLESAKNILLLLKTQQNSSITNITKLFQDYRILINRKGQHIHPMLYEDVILQLNRAKLQTIPKLETNIIELKQNKLKLQKQLIQKQQIIQNKNQSIKKFNCQLTLKTQYIQVKQVQIKDLKNQINTLNKQISTNKSQIKTHSQTIQNNQQKIKQLSNSLLITKQQVKSQSNTLSTKQLEIQRLNLSIGQLSQKISNYQAQMQKKLKSNPHLIKIQKLQKQIIQLNKQLKIFKSVIRDDVQIQTQPQGEVVIQLRATGFSRKNKFVNENIVRNDKQCQVVLPPYDSIPEYIDNKISQIQREQYLKDDKNDSKISFVMKSKQRQQIQGVKLINNKSLSKLQVPKQQLTKRQQLRRALRFTYMRR